MTKQTMSDLNDRRNMIKKMEAYCARKENL